MVTWLKTCDRPIVCLLWLGADRGSGGTGSRNEPRNMLTSHVPSCLVWELSCTGEKGSRACLFSLFFALCQNKDCVTKAAFWAIPWKCKNIFIKITNRWWFVVSASMFNYSNEKHFPDIRWRYISLLQRRIQDHGNLNFNSTLAVSRQLVKREMFLRGERKVWLSLIL